MLVGKFANFATFIVFRALSREQLKDLWITLQTNDNQGLQKFEDFLQKVMAELRQAQNDSAQLETALKRSDILHIKIMTIKDVTV